MFIKPFGPNCTKFWSNSRKEKSVTLSLRVLVHSWAIPHGLAAAP